MTTGMQEKPPAWVEPTLRSLDRLLHLPPNWDSYGGRSIAHSSVWATLQLLTKILTDDTPVPAVVPTGRGGVKIEWHRNGVDLEIEILSPHRYLAAFEDAKTGESWERELTEDFRLLAPVVARLVSCGR
jgi:hypothetical protein